jgi:hypothetical protein
MSVWGSFVQLDSASLSAEFQGQMVSHVSSSSLPRIFQSAKPFQVSCDLLVS